jgi:hypothetical protein
MKINKNQQFSTTRIIRIYIQQNKNIKEQNNKYLNNNILIIH